MKNEKTAVEIQGILNDLEDLAYRVSWIDVRTSGDAELKETLQSLIQIVRRLV